MSLASLVLAACTSSLEPVSTSSLVVEAVSTTRFDGTVGMQVYPLPTVRVVDAAGAPVRGVSLFAEITAGDGWVARSTLITEQSGEARIGWTLGGRVGINTLTVRAPHASAVVFTASATHGPIANIQLMGSGERVLPGTTVPDPLSARVQDAYGNPVPGAPVTFTVASGGGTIDVGTAVSDSSGVARAGRWTLGPTGAVQTVSIRAGALEATLTANVFICAEPIPGSCAAPLELAFTRPSDAQIYRVRSDGFGLIRLTTAGRNWAPAWSPDGRRIAFIRRGDMGGDTDVWVMDTDGSNSARRTANGSYGSVAWSPDGKRLAVSTEGVYSSTSYVFDAVADGTDGNEVVIPRSRRPTWSPDGRRIAFIEPSGDDGYETVWVVNADGTGRRQLTRPGNSVWARMAWSPDGLEVIYTDAGVIWAVKADGSGRREVTANGAEGVDVSRDGNWLAVTTSSLESWRPSIGYLPMGYLPVGGGVPTVLVADGYDAVWRPR